MRLRIFKPTDPEDLVGLTFDDLKVVRKTTERQGGHVIWECKCICGRKTRVRTTRLTNKITKYCGKCQRKFGRASSVGRK